jgi:hypothetical protein
MRADPHAPSRDPQRDVRDRVLRLFASQELADELALWRAVLTDGVREDAGLTAAQQLHAGAALPAAVEVREVRHRDGARARAGRDPHVADVCARWRERRGDAMELMNACREERGTKNGNERR